MSEKTPAREHDAYDPEQIPATEQAKQHFKELVEKLADSGEIANHGMSQSESYDLEDGRRLSVRRRMSIVNPEEMGKLEQALYLTGALADIKLRRRFPSGAMEMEDYSLNRDLQLERDYDLTDPDRKPISEMTEEELDKLEKELDAIEPETFGKQWEEEYGKDQLARKLGMKTVTEAEAQKINALLQYVLSEREREKREISL